MADATTKRRDANVYQTVTDKVIDALKCGVAPWRQPWRSLQAQNAVSGRPYRGVNVFLLALSPCRDPRWLTFHQARGLGGSVRKGEKGSPVIFWRWLEKIGKEEEEKPERIPLLRQYTVFNVEQCDGLKIEPLTDSTAEKRSRTIEPAVRIVEAMPRPPTIVHGSQAAAYFPSRDEVRLPDPEAFEQVEAYYSTCFHELIHSTGHSSRLHRSGITEGARFGSEVYSKEELVAEMGAAFLAAEAGIDCLDQSAAYLDGWLRALQGDRWLVVSAAAAAARAADYVLGTQPEHE